VFEEAQLELQLFRGQILGRAPSAIERRQERVRQNLEERPLGMQGFDPTTGRMNRDNYQLDTIGVGASRVPTNVN